MPAFGAGGYCDLAKSRRYYAIFIRWASYKFVGCIRDRGYSVQFGSYPVREPWLLEPARTVAAEPR